MRTRIARTDHATPVGAGTTEVSWGFSNLLRLQPLGTPRAYTCPMPIRLRGLAGPDVLA